MNIPNAPDDITSTIILPVDGDELGNYPKYNTVSGAARIVGLILTLITMAVGATLWAGNQHADIRSWTMDQIYSTKTEVIDVMKDQFVEQKAFVRIEEKLSRQEIDIKDMKVKIDKMSQRLELAQLNQMECKPAITSLNQTEKNVFLVLYTEEIPLSYKEIAEKASLPLAMVPECISSLISKGIPFQRSFYNGQLFLKLEQKFKDMQAKENLVNLSLKSFIE